MSTTITTFPLSNKPLIAFKHKKMIRGDRSSILIIEPTQELSMLFKITKSFYKVF